MKVLFFLNTFSVALAIAQSAAAAAGVSAGVSALKINTESESVSIMAANSKAGMSLLSKSRALEGGEGGEGEGENKNENQNNNEVDTSWMTGYSIKFLGCHHVATWNDYADEQEDVRIKVNRQVRYRICPAGSCSDKKAMGCTSGYGDYVVDMDTFLQAYIQNNKDLVEQECENLFYQCGCQNYYGDEYQCQYNCASSKKMYQCINQNNAFYYGGYGSQNLKDVDLDGYTYCTEFNGEYNAEGNNNDKDKDKDRRTRKLDQGYNNQYQNQYFLGPYCADKGDEIRFGMFTDDTCTEFADTAGGATTYYKTFGSEIPYRGKSLVNTKCYSCKNIDYDNGGQVETKEMCENTYMTAGKCESNLSSYAVYNKNTNACSFIEGIKIVKHSSNGVIYIPYHGSKVAATWIAIFATTFVLLAFYVCYLKKKIAMALMSRSSSRNSQPEKKSFLQKLISNLSPKNMKKKFSFSRSNHKRSSRHESLM